MFKFDNIEIEAFIKGSIPTYQQEKLLMLLQKDYIKIEDVELNGKVLTGEANNNLMFLNTGPSIQKTSFWECVKKEVYNFICTESETYSHERGLIGKNFKELTTIIATAIGTKLSLGTGVIIGIVTNILIGVIKLKKNAWCEYQKENMNK
ncbi:hypothetical protein [Pontibacter sp. H249]|uniref:hypothetical protein n=1 Tax=Pontibacter sp. H249 TaxID=3133420 RepID=UPI0030BE1D84